MKKEIKISRVFRILMLVLSIMAIHYPALVLGYPNINQLHSDVLSYKYYIKNKPTVAIKSINYNFPRVWIPSFGIPVIKYEFDVLGRLSAYSYFSYSIDNKIIKIDRKTEFIYDKDSDRLTKIHYQKRSKNYVVEVKEIKDGKSCKLILRLYEQKKIINNLLSVSEMYFSNDSIMRIDWWVKQKQNDKTGRTKVFHSKEYKMPLETSVFNFDNNYLYIPFSLSFSYMYSQSNLLLFDSDDNIGKLKINNNKFFITLPLILKTNDTLPGQALVRPLYLMETCGEKGDTCQVHQVNYAYKNNKINTVEKKNFTHGPIMHESIRSFFSNYPNYQGFHLRQQITIEYFDN